MDATEELMDLRKIAIRQRDELDVLREECGEMREEIRAIKAVCHRLGHRTGSAISRVNAIVDMLQAQDDAVRMTDEQMRNMLR